jgi:hypothetical protein
MAAPADERRRPDEKGAAPGKGEPAADPEAKETWGGEGGAGDYRGGPTTSPDAARGPGGNPELM